MSFISKEIRRSDSRNFCTMESNVIAPLQWEWENQGTLSISATEISQKLRSPEWDIEGDSGVYSGYLYTSVVAGPGPGQLCLSKSSKSASTDSSSVGEVKAAKFDLKEEKGNGAVSSPTLESSDGSTEPVLSLNLCKQIYLRSESDAMVSSHSIIPTKKFKTKPQTNQAPLCQVEGCNLDLSSAKDYYRKHRVCTNHSRSPKVTIAGVECRFCQQCSRFHGLLEFDAKKRSCRKRLSHHNARRRKPQTDAFHHAPMLYSAPHGADGKQEPSFVWHQMQFAQIRGNEDLSWEGMVSSKPIQIKSHSSAKVEKIEGQLLMPGVQQLSSMSMNGYGSHGFPTSQADRNTSELFNQGMDESTVPSNIGDAQDIQRALSLLSTDAWSPCKPKLGSLNYSIPALHSGAPGPPAETGSLGFPLAEFVAWQSRQPLPATIDGRTSTTPFKDCSC